MGVVETERHRLLAGMDATADEAVDGFRGHGPVAVLGEMPELRLQTGRRNLVQVKDGEQAASRPAEDEGRIPARREIDQPSQRTAALGERYMSRRAHHAHRRVFSRSVGLTASLGIETNPSSPRWNPASTGRRSRSVAETRVPDLAKHVRDARGRGIGVEMTLGGGAPRPPGARRGGMRH